MSMINLNIEQLKNINNEIKINYEKLFNLYFSNLETELNSINNNIHGENISSFINTINNNFLQIKNNMNTELLKLTNFIDAQVKDYRYNETELAQILTNVIKKIQSFVYSFGDPNIPSPNDPDYHEIMKERAELEGRSFGDPNIPSPNDPDYHEIMHERANLENNN